MSVTLLASQVPIPIGFSGLTLLSSVTPITSQSPSGSFGAGYVAVAERNALRSDLGSRYGGGAYAIAYGLGLSALSGQLKVRIAAGHLIADGINELAADYDLVVPESTTHVHIWAKRGLTFQAVATSLTPPSGAIGYLGSVTTSATEVTATEEAGVLRLVSGMLIRQTADTGKPSDSPSANTAFWTRTAGGLYLWDGIAYSQAIPCSAMAGIADVAAMTAPTTMGASYSQTEAQQLRNDIAAVRTTLAAIQAILKR